MKFVLSIAFIGISAVVFASTLEQLKQRETKLQRELRGIRAEMAALHTNGTPREGKGDQPECLPG
jgi:uncharacterized protein involved in exopolysaccharide biosynthesis